MDNIITKVLSNIGTQRCNKIPGFREYGCFPLASHHVSLLGFNNIAHMLPPSLLSFSQEPLKATLYIDKQPPGARAGLLFPLATISMI